MADVPFIPNINESLPRKILFLGDENIGKTTFIRTFLDHVRNVRNFDCYTGTFLVFTQFIFYQPLQGQRFPIQLLDLPAGTTAESRTDQYPTEVNLIVLCFAVDNPTSLANVMETWIPEFRQYYPNNAARYYLLGLKKDLREKPDITPVPLERAQQIHRQHGFSGEYMECAADGNIEPVIYMMSILIADMLYDEFNTEP